MSAPLIWDIVRRESSFLRKSNGIELSAEPLNVRNKNSFKFSGLSQAKAVGVNVIAVKGKGDKVVLSTKTAKKNSPKKGVSLTYLTHGKPRALKAVNGAAHGYRTDLNRAALAKYTLLQKGVQKKIKQNGVAPKPKTRRRVTA